MVAGSLLHLNTSHRDRGAARIAALIRASVDAGTPPAHRSGAWIMAGPNGAALEGLTGEGPW